MTSYHWLLSHDVLHKGRPCSTTGRPVMRHDVPSQLGNGVMRFEITHPNDLLAIEPDIIYSLYKLRVWLMRTRQWRLLGTMELGML
jgi:hypothetical protein